MAAVTTEQISMMLDFMENHHDMALGRFGRTTEGRTLSKMLWGELARELNSVPNGISKSAQAWRTYYNEFKSKTMTRIKTYRDKLPVSDEIGRHKTKFTPLQLRLYNILGSASETGEPLLQVVRQNPLNKTNDGTNGSRSNAEADANNAFPLWSFPDLPVLDAVDVPCVHDEDDQVTEDDDSRQRRGGSRDATSPCTATNPRGRGYRRNQQPYNHDHSGRFERLKIRASQQQTLASREQAQAVRVHAQAINRMAAAIERFADVFVTNHHAPKKERFSFVPVATSDNEEDRRPDEDGIKDEGGSDRRRASDD